MLTGAVVFLLGSLSAPGVSAQTASYAQAGTSEIDLEQVFRQCSADVALSPSLIFVEDTGAETEPTIDPVPSTRIIPADDVESPLTEQTLAEPVIPADEESDVPADPFVEDAPPSEIPSASDREYQDHSLEQLRPERNPEFGFYDPYFYHEGCDPCCDSMPVNLHRCSVFAEALVLRPGNTDVVYAVEQTGCDPATSSPTGPVGETAIDFSAGVRGGITWALTDCSSLVATYSWWEGDTYDEIQAGPGRTLASQVTHPSLHTCASNNLGMRATQSLSFQTVDLDYRRLIAGDCDFAINWQAGLRYGHLEQEFQSVQDLGITTGITDVRSEVVFDGMGIRFGLDGERRSRRTGLMIYAKGFANFLGGEFQADYRQVNTQVGGTAVLASSSSDYRIISILEAELGVGWQSKCGKYRLTAGCLSSGWFNTITTDHYLQSVRSGDFHDIGDTLSFNGLAARFEIRH